MKILEVIIKELAIRYMKKILIFGFTTILVCFGCDKKDSSFQKTQWFLSSVQNTKTNEEIQSPTSVSSSEYITFMDSLVEVKGVCNNAGQSIYSFSTINDSIKINGVGSTFIFCPYIEWEYNLWHNLDSAYAYKINGNNLIIYSKGTYNLNFIAK
jgi:heat shock protein HslJ